MLTVVGFYLGKNLELKLSLTDLLPEDSPSVTKFNQLTEIVGGVGFLIVLLEADDQESHLKVAPKLIKELERSDLVRTAFIEREEFFFANRMLYYLSETQLKDLEKAVHRRITKARSKVVDLGLFDDDPASKKEEIDQSIIDNAKKAADIGPNLVSKDGKFLLLMIKPTFDSMDLGKSEKLANDTKEIMRNFAPSNVKWELSGRYYRKIEDTKIITSDIAVLGLIAIILIVGVLFAYLKSIRTLVLIVAPVLCGVGITVGTTYLVIGHVNIITGFLMGIVSGLGMDYSVHLVLRLRLEHQNPSFDDPDPIWRSLATGGHGVFVGAIAASAAFFLLCFSDFRAFSEFGFVCGVGIAAVSISILATFSTLSKWLKLDTAREKDLVGRKWVRLPTLTPKRNFYIALVVTAALMILSLGVGFEYDLTKMMQHSSHVKKVEDLINKIYDRSVSPSAFAAPDKATAIAIEEALEEKYMPHTVQKVVSGATIIPTQQKLKRQYLYKIKRHIKGFKDSWIEKELGINGKTIRTWVNARPFGFNDIPIHLQDLLRGKSQDSFLMYIYAPLSLDTSTATGIYAFSNMVKDIESKFPKMLSGSDTVLFREILDLIKRDGFFILAAIFICVGFFIWLNLREWDAVLTTYLPLLIALPVGIGMMAILGIKFNIFNIAIIPSFVAIGIDAPIHIVHRARQIGSGFKAARDLAPAVNLALATTGVGFGALAFARAGVLRSLGWLAILGTLAIWWTGLFLLPAFLEWYYGRKKK